MDTVDGGPEKPGPFRSMDLQSCDSRYARWSSRSGWGGKGRFPVHDRSPGCQDLSRAAQVAAKLLNADSAIGNPERHGTLRSASGETGPGNDSRDVILREIPENHSANLCAGAARADLDVGSFFGLIQFRDDGIRFVHWRRERLVVHQRTLRRLGLICGPGLELAPTLRIDRHVIDQDRLCY